MTKTSHLKSLVAPNTWKLNKKHNKFILRPKAGAHKQKLSISLNKVLIDTGKAQTNREVTYMLNNHKILIDSRQRKDPAFPIGLFDIITYPEINEAFTIIINKLGKLILKKLKDPKSDKKLIRIVNKREVKSGKVQIETFCGRNILVDDKEASKYKTGDSLMIKLPEQKIVDHIKLEKGALICLIQGSHVGLVRKIKEIKDERMICADDKEDFETKKKHAFVINEEIKKLLSNN